MGFSLLFSQDHIPVSNRAGFLIWPLKLMSAAAVEPLSMFNFRLGAAPRSRNFTNMSVHVSALLGSCYLKIDVPKKICLVPPLKIFQIVNWGSMSHVTAPAGATVTSSCCRRSAADVLLPTFCCRQSTHCFHPKLKKCSFNILMCYKGACYTKFALPQNSR